MPISKIKSSSITADAASTNLNIDANTLFLDTTNNRVGVGNTAPDVKLQVTETIDVGIAMSNSSSVTSGNRGSLAMFNSANSTVGLIRFGAVTDNVGTDIQFYTRPAAGALSQTMTLTSAGNLGIGTTNPQFKFHVRGADATSLFVVGNTTEDTRLEVSTYQDDRIVLRANDSSNVARSIAFETGLTERMRIDSSGNVGIGKSSPAATLDIVGPSAGASPYLSKSIQFAPSNFPDRTWSLNYDDSGSAGNGFNISSQSTKILYLNGNGTGKVGIGTVSPAAQLDVENSSAQPFGTAAQLNAIFKGSVSIGQGGAIGFDYFGSHTNAPTSMGYAIESQAGNTKGSLVFGTRSVTTDTAPTERMRINSDGEVLIGATAQGRETNLAVVGSYQDPTGVWTQVGIYSTDTQAANKGGTIGFGGQDGSLDKQQFAAIKGAKENSTSTNYAGYMAFYSRPAGDVTAERMRITSVGAVGISTIPSAWDSTYSGRLQIGQVGTFASFQDLNVAVAKNGYFNGNWKYTVNSTAALSQIEGNTFIWYQATSGAADSNISWSERARINSDGSLLVGTSTLPGSQSGRIFVGPYTSNNGFGSFNYAAPSGGTTSFPVCNSISYRVTIFSTQSSTSAAIGVYIFVGLNKSAGYNPQILTVNTVGSPGWTFSYTALSTYDTTVTVTDGGTNQGTRVIVEQLG